MEKLKPKHDHKLTDIIKVAIFGLMLLLPFISWMPNAFYYGFNEHAVVGQEEQYYNFYQGVKNGKPTNTDYWVVKENANISLDNETNSLKIQATSLDLTYFINDNIFNLLSGHAYYFCLTAKCTDNCHLQVMYENESTQTFLDTYIYNNDFEVFSNISTSNDGDIDWTLEFYCDHYDNLYLKNIMLFDLTQIFGNGNEPTKEEFENMLTQEYYNYGNNYVLKDRGTNITWSMYNSWEDVWQTPLFSWTNNSILKTGLNAFCEAFGIVDSSYITNLLVYELVIVAIYIVLDIVLTLFKWLTHIGQKE